MANGFRESATTVSHDALSYCFRDESICFEKTILKLSFLGNSGSFRWKGGFWNSWLLIVCNYIQQWDLDVCQGFEKCLLGSTIYNTFCFRLTIKIRQRVITAPVIPDATKDKDATFYTKITGKNQETTNNHACSKS